MQCLPRRLHLRPLVVGTRSTCSEQAMRIANAAGTYQNLSVAPNTAAHADAKERHSLGLVRAGHGHCSKLQQP
jgi:hypothetical protein